MAYNSELLRLLGPSALDGSFQLWLYDTNDATGDIDTDGYVTDAVKKGMKRGDLVLVRQWQNAPEKGEPRSEWGTLSAIGWYTVMSVGTATANLSTTSALSVTNTD